MNAHKPTTPSPAAQSPAIDVPLMLFLALTSVIGIAGTAVYTYLHGFALWMSLLALAMYLAVWMSFLAP